MSPYLKKQNHSRESIQKPIYKLADVLLIDDSPGDIALTEAILKQENIHFNLHIQQDSEEAINFLRTGDEVVMRLDLVLVDFNMPKYSGLDVLKFIKNTDILNRIPVIVLSGSDTAEDINAAEAAGAQGYLVKPIDKETLSKAVKSISELTFVSDGNRQLLRVCV